MRMKVPRDKIDVKEKVSPLIWVNEELAREDRIFPKFSEYKNTVKIQNSNLNLIILINYSNMKTEIKPN